MEGSSEDGFWGASEDSDDDAVPGLALVVTDDEQEQDDQCWGVTKDEL
jgi:hypothetical protein